MAYHWVLHADRVQALTSYRQRLATHGVQQAGAFLREQLRDRHPNALSNAELLQALVDTKRPQYFAESAVYGDGRDWNPTELALLGDLGFAVAVRVFDDGRHQTPRIHERPFEATLLFVPGALLRNGRGCTPSDWPAVVRDQRIDEAAYCALYERRLLPLLEHANAEAAALGQGAVITVPGLGCGQFAGPFAGLLGAHLQTALMRLLERHAHRLPQVRLVYYDPYVECSNQCFTFGHLTLRVRPFLQGNAEKPQLCAPACYAEPGDDLGHCRLYSVVAWDQVSWPGNDYWAGARMTDDGVKAAATDLMRAITGVAGRYDPSTHAYRPPPPYSTWEGLVQDQGTRLVVSADTA